MPKQTRKSKEEVKAALDQKAKVDRMRTLARSIFPAVTNLKTIYDAQTAFNAAAGHMKAGLVEQESKLRVSDLNYDFGKGTSDVDRAVKNIIECLSNEPATEAFTLVDLMGNKLPQFLAHRGLEQSMETITVDEFIA